MATKMEGFYLNYFYQVLQDYLPSPVDTMLQLLGQEFVLEELRQGRNVQLPIVFHATNAMPYNQMPPDSWAFEELERTEQVCLEIRFLRWMFVNGTNRCYGIRDSIIDEINDRYEEHFCYSRYPLLDVVDLEALSLCRTNDQLALRNGDLSEDMASELEYLTYFYKQVDNYLGPASGDIYLEIEESYEKQSGEKLDSSLNFESPDSYGVAYLRYFYKEVQDAMCGSEGDILHELVSRFEKEGKRAPSYYRYQLTIEEVEMEWDDE